jgi:hypothetical protein
MDVTYLRVIHSTIVAQEFDPELRFIRFLQQAI